MNHSYLSPPLVVDDYTMSSLVTMLNPYGAHESEEHQRLVRRVKEMFTHMFPHCCLDTGGSTLIVPAEPVVGEAQRQRWAVGLGGHKESGKDELVQHAPSTWRVIGMSDALMETMLFIDPWIDSEHSVRFSHALNTVHGDRVALKKIPEIRRLLITWGTDVIRNHVDKNFWVNEASHRVRALVNDGYNVVLTGIRFPNERDIITAQPFHRTVWVDRPHHVRTVFTSHESENSLTASDFQYVVHNDSTVEALRQQGSDLLKRLEQSLGSNLM